MKRNKPTMKKKSEPSSQTQKPPEPEAMIIFDTVFGALTGYIVGKDKVGFHLLYPANVVSHLVPEDGGKRFRHDIELKPVAYSDEPNQIYRLWYTAIRGDRSVMWLRAEFEKFAKQGAAGAYVFNHYAPGPKMSMETGDGKSEIITSTVAILDPIKPEPKPVVNGETDGQ